MLDKLPGDETDEHARYIEADVEWCPCRIHLFSQWQSDWTQKNSIINFGFMDRVIDRTQTVVG